MKPSRETLREGNINSIRINGETKLLGSSEEEKTMDEEMMTTREGNEKIDELIAKGFTPVFKMTELDNFDSLTTNGLDPKKPLAAGQKETIGSIGRLHFPQSQRGAFLVAVIDPTRPEAELSPRPSARGGTRFIGAVTPLHRIPWNNLVILDPDTLEILSAPPGVSGSLEKTIVVNGRTQSLGNRVKGTQIEQDEYNDVVAAREEVDELIDLDYLPTFPLSKERLHEVTVKGLQKSRGNIPGSPGWRGTIGRQPAAADYYAVIIDRKVARKDVAPFMDAKKNGEKVFKGSIILHESIGPESVAIINAKSGKTEFFPSKSVQGAIRVVRKDISRIRKEREDGDED